MSEATKIRKANAEKLAAGYTTEKRALETISCIAWAVTVAFNLFRVARFLVNDPSVDSGDYLKTAALCFGAIFVADFLSGVAHWTMDTWGTPQTFLFGPVIRSFREHHVDQMAMTKHDLIETNGDSCLLVTVVLLIPQCFFSVSKSMGMLNDPAVHMTIVFFGVLIALTNQFHKTSHEVRPHPILKFLMACHLILTPQNHRRHHSGDFSQSYCITTGWCNVTLDVIRFWRIMETIVTSCTGAIPRANDLEFLGESAPRK